MTETTKSCSKCERELPLFEFRADKRVKSGRGSWCRRCAAEDAQQRRDAEAMNRDGFAEQRWTEEQRQAHVAALRRDHQARMRRLRRRKP